MTGRTVAPAHITLCFFGITRSLPYTIDALQRNVIGPVAQLAPYTVLAHFFEQREIDNPRSGEKILLSPEDWKLLAPDWVRIDPPDLFLPEIGAEEIAAHGDTWEDGGRSLRNLLHQLQSLDIVTREALAQSRAREQSGSVGSELFLFLRPDLHYHDDVTPSLMRLCANPAAQVVMLANWQHWFGLNDRFALCKGQQAAAVYGQRLHAVPGFCRLHGPLHGEKLLEHVISEGPVTLHLTGLRASRIRADGRAKRESFLHFRLHHLHRRMVAAAYRVYVALGLAWLRKAMK